MAMTRTDAVALNVVLRWVLGLPWSSGLTPTVDEAQTAAGQLADRARAALGGGLDGSTVRGLWPARAVPSVSATARLYRTPGDPTALLAEQAPGPRALMRARVVVPLPHDDATAGALATDLDVYAVQALVDDSRAWLAAVVGTDPLSAGGVDR